MKTSSAKLQAALAELARKHGLDGIIAAAISRKSDQVLSVAVGDMNTHECLAMADAIAADADRAVQAAEQRRYFQQAVAGFPLN